MRSKPSSAMRLLLCSSVVLTAFASVIRAPLEKRADPLEDFQLEIQDKMANDPNRANTDGTAGIGAEFETPEFYFETDCSAEDTNAAKYKVVAGRTGENWKLTADSIGDAGKLYAEYIIDGNNVKVGSTDDATNGAKVAAAMAQDLIDWKPWTGDEAARKVDIADNNCNPWRIMTPKSRAPEEVEFQAQITTGMPLEALYSLMKENLEEDPQPRNVLNGIDRYDGEYLNLVTKAHFQSSPGGIGPEKATDDVLAFCTLVLSYAKVARENAGSSPKLFTAFMPRTHFNKLLSHVSAKLPTKGDDLWALFNVLACYQSGGDNIDENYCRGTVANPQPTGNRFGRLTFSQGDAKCNIRDWIHGLDPESEDQDALSKFDEVNDGSIGRLGTKEEKMFNSQRFVPLFEFRDLENVKTIDMGGFMGRVDKAIQDLHNNFANPPTGPTKQHALNIILEQTDLDYGKGLVRREMKWLFYPTAFGTASQCSDHPVPAAVADNLPNTVRGVQNGYMTDGCPTLFNEDLTKVPAGCNGPNYINNIPYPAGTYSVGIEGENCEYKNNGQDNAGAVWCGDTFKSSCKAHDDKEKANLDGVVTCDNLSHPSESPGKPAKIVSHRAVVACEW